MAATEDRDFEPELVPSGAALVPRADLFARLSDTEPGQVTMVCAPAGSGKTVLIASWARAARLQTRLAWVSVERGERDAQSFWLSVIDELATVFDEVQRVDPAPGFRGQAVIDQVRGDLLSLQVPGLLVLDDLHELESDDARTWLEQFLTRMPPLLRVVLVSREDPQLGLHRLRLSGRLTEIRAPDLRFSLAEARQLIRGSGVTLSDAGLTLLYERTEGWAAGLRLAAISLHHHPDPERFVREFSGSERTVAGYLVDEVLERQSPEVRNILLRTAVLERVSGPLADRLTGGAGAERALIELEEAGAFVTAEDASRTWFRYHHLFGDLLQLELRRVDPSAPPSLHRSAAAWFEEHGDVVAAVRHAQAASDWAHAGRLLFENRIGLILDGRLDTVRALLEAFPRQAILSDPEVAVTLAGVRLRDGHRAEADAYLAIAERGASDRPLDRQALFRMQLASVKLQAARQRGNLDNARAAMRALDEALQDDPDPNPQRANELRALGLMTLGITELWAGQLEDAKRNLEAGLLLARRIGRPFLQIGCLAHLGIVAPLTGLSPSTALGFTEEAVALAEEHGLATDPVVALAFAIGGGSLALLGRFGESEQFLDRAERTLHPEGDPASELALCHARGLLRGGQGRLEEAVASFRSAQEMQALLAGEHALSVDVELELVLSEVRAGNLVVARAQLEDLPQAERDRAEGRIATGAVELASGDAERAVETLRPVSELAVPALIPGWAAVWALLYMAAAHAHLNDALSAERSLEGALELAEPHGLILPFAMAPVRQLLESHPRHRSAHGAFLATITDVLSGAAPPSRRDAPPLLEELSDAELRVVRYLPTNLRAREIAAELLVSTNTVRTHLRHIYAKLDAHDRAEAVARARELGLLAPSLRRR